VIAALARGLLLALTLLFIRSALSQLDVPTRPAYVMSAVMPPARAAAASMTAVLEPGTLALLCLGLAGVAFTRRRKQ
jgi:hypothetical protein